MMFSDLTMMVVDEDLPYYLAFNGNDPRRCTSEEARSEWLAARQTDAFIKDMENTEWYAKAALTKSPNGFVRLDLAGLNTQGITPACWLTGTAYEHMPFHISLGYMKKIGLNNNDLRDIQVLLNGSWRFTLKKLSSRRESTTYVPQGALWDALEHVRKRYGFKLRCDWHVSF